MKITYKKVADKNLNNFTDSIKQNRANVGAARTMVFIIPLIYLFSLFEWIIRLIFRITIKEIKHDDLTSNKPKPGGYFVR